MTHYERRKSEKRVAIWLLLGLTTLAIVGLPIYRAASQSASGVSSATTNSILDASNSLPSEIPIRFAYHTNGTASVWFQGESNGIYRIDCADTKASSLSDMTWDVAVE